MKRKLLFLLIGLFVITGSKAQFSALPYAEKQENLKSSTEDLIKFGYCSDDIENSIGINSSAALSAAIAIPMSKYSFYAGLKIKKIKIGLTANSTNVSVWIRSSLTGADLVTETITGTVAKGWKEVTLTTPYTIPDADIYIGYTATGNGQIGFSGNSLYDGNWLWHNSWDNYVSSGWGSVCIQAFIDHEGQTILDLGMESLNKIYTKINEDFTIKASVRNNSTVAVTELKVAYKVGDENPVERTIQTSIAPGAVAPINIPADAITTNGVYDLSVSILELNGQADNFTANNTLTGTLEVFEHIFPRKVVVEEGTGLGCQWCPRGMVGMALMKEKYPETFIGIAVHNTVFGADAMTVPAYANALGPILGNAYPNCVVNRKAALVGDPYYDVEDFYLSEMEILSQIGITLTGGFSDSNLNTIELTTLTTFGYPVDNANFKLAYVLVENGVTGYTQVNAYAGGANGEMGGFENLPRNATGLEFNDVARGIYSGFKGISGSVPSVITELVPIGNAYTISLPKVQNKDNLEAIVFLLNADGEIQNADKIEISTSPVEFGLSFTYPSDNSERIPLDSDISAVFSKSLTIASTTGVTVNGEPATISASERTLIIDYGKLAPDTEYTVKIPTGTVEGLSESVEWKFKTIKATGIEKVNTGSTKVYPTVSTGKLTVVTEKAATVKVIDITGRNLATYKSNGYLDIDLNYSKGIYFIVIDDNRNGKVSTHKVILKR